MSKFPSSIDRKKRYLIVNADDYGYFSSVSKGILDGAGEGVITASGIMANSPELDKYLRLFSKIDTLDAGVHLNLSHGEPLTERMRQLLSRWEGRFPTKFQMASAILLRKVAFSAVEEEWRAQIMRCVVGGIKPVFLNSHEHLHMLPGLFEITAKLAKEFGIQHIRHSSPEWEATRDISDWVRNLVLGGTSIMTPNNSRHYRAVRFIGASASGRLSMEYFRRKLPRLKPGQVYELMCHPGHFDPNEIQDPSLLAYHAWEQELCVLRSSEFRELCESCCISLIGFRDLPTSSAQQCSAPL
jgi:predicted glycoside hydrolase/deacetylase ChbG (UPF0249 family)